METAKPGSGTLSAFAAAQVHVENGWTYDGRLDGKLDKEAVKPGCGLLSTQCCGAGARGEWLDQRWGDGREAGHGGCQAGLWRAEQRGG